MRAILEALDRSQAIIEFDPKGVILTANANFLRVMGYSLAEIQGRHHSIFIDPAERDSAAYRELWDALAAGRFQAGQFRRLGKGGREVWIEASYNPILDRRGRVTKVVKFASDVTAEKRQFAELLAQASAIGKSQAVIAFDLDGTILDANQNFLDAMGYTLEEVKGRHHSMFVDPVQRNGQDYRQFWEKLRRGEFHAGQFRRLGKGGREVWIEASYNPILDLAGRPWKVVKYATDITRQMALLADLRRIIDQNFGEIDGAVAKLDQQSGRALEATGETSRNVQSVASASEQLSASIREIARRMAQSRAATEAAHAHTDAADKATLRLADSTKAMTGIVQLIQEIASQINLLALNATIESARAGEAGKGFAVVAGEVKNLANQAAAATQRIAEEIEGIQAVSEDVVGALDTIKSAIGSVREFVTATAGAVEEQSAVTGEMASSMTSASRAVASIGNSIEDIAAAIRQTTEAVNRTRDAAKVLAR